MDALISRTIDLARANVEEGGRPFACVIARGDDVVAESPNLVAQTHDPTAHAEVLAIRDACTRLGTEHLEGCDIYALAYPCPMCLGALYYCSPDRVIFVTSREDYIAFYQTTASTSSSTPSTPSSPSRTPSAGCRCPSSDATTRSRSIASGSNGIAEQPTTRTARADRDGSCCRRGPALG